MSPPSFWSMSPRTAARETRDELLAITSWYKIPVSAFVASRSGFDSDSPALSTTNQRPPTHDLPWLATCRGMPPEEPIHR